MKIIYAAFDGTQFETEEDCMKYEGKILAHRKKAHLTKYFRLKREVLPLKNQFYIEALKTDWKVYLGKDCPTKKLAQAYKQKRIYEQGISLYKAIKELKEERQCLQAIEMVEKKNGQN